MAFSVLEIPPKAAKITDEDAGSKFLQIKIFYIFIFVFTSIVTLLSVPSKRAVRIFSMTGYDRESFIIFYFLDKAVVTNILTNNVVDPDLVDP